MTMATWTYLTLDGERRTVKTARGTVVESDAPSYPVGMKVAAGQMRARGWRTPKRVKQYDAWGRVVR
jgi:hypothetical protein